MNEGRGVDDELDPVERRLQGGAVADVHQYERCFRALDPRRRAGVEVQPRDLGALGGQVAADHVADESARRPVTAALRPSNLLVSHASSSGQRPVSTPAPWALILAALCAPAFVAAVAREAPAQALCPRARRRRARERRSPSRVAAPQAPHPGSGHASRPPRRARRPSPSSFPASQGPRCGPLRAPDVGLHGHPRAARRRPGAASPPAPRSLPDPPPIGCSAWGSRRASGSSAPSPGPGGDRSRSRARDGPLGAGSSSRTWRSPGSSCAYARFAAGGRPDGRGLRPRMCHLLARSRRRLRGGPREEGYMAEAEGEPRETVRAGDVRRAYVGSWSRPARSTGAAPGRRLYESLAATRGRRCPRFTSRPRRWPRSCSPRRGPLAGARRLGLRADAGLRARLPRRALRRSTSSPAPLWSRAVRRGRAARRAAGARAS